MNNFNDGLNRIGKNLMSIFSPRKCPFCGRALGKELPCSECMKELTFADETVEMAHCTLTYALLDEGKAAKAADDFLTRSKIDGLSSFGVLLSQCVKERLDGQFDLITWLPLTKEEIKRRKYDANRFLCASVCVDWHTQPEELLKKEGKQVALLPNGQIADKRILLLGVNEQDREEIDACASVLLEGGASGVVAAVLVGRSYKEKAKN